MERPLHKSATTLRDDPLWPEFAKSVCGDIFPSEEVKLRWEKVNCTKCNDLKNQHQDDKRLRAQNKNNFARKQRRKAKAKENFYIPGTLR